MKETPLSDWTLDAVKQREVKRRKKEEAEAPLVSRKQREEILHTKEMPLGNWTLLDALKKREEERRKKEEAEAGLVSAAPAKIADLRSQLKAVAAERDRNAYEKIEIVPKTNKAIKERDDLRAEFAIVAAERDRQAFEKSEVIAKANSLAKECDELRDRFAAVSAERDRLLAEKTDIERAVETTLAETARLRHQIESTPPVDPARVLFDFAAEQTKTLVAKIRAMIPLDSPALPWFDKTVAIATAVGCFAVQETRGFVCWIIPRWRKLYAFLKGEIEARLAERR